MLMNRFELVDVARKVVGVGSVGTRCWIALFEGGADDDPLLLQIKEAQPSVLERSSTSTRSTATTASGSCTASS